MLFIYGKRDPHCSCCRWEYHFSSYEDNEEEKAHAVAANLEAEDYCVTLIKGESVEISPAAIKKLQDEKDRKIEEAKRKLEREKEWKARSLS
jgi:hypothetical protein